MIGNAADLYKVNHPLVICTDDSGVFSTSVSKEYSLAASAFGNSELYCNAVYIRLKDNGLRHLFFPDRSWEKGNISVGKRRYWIYICRQWNKEDSESGVWFLRNKPGSMILSAFDMHGIHFSRYSTYWCISKFEDHSDFLVLILLKPVLFLQGFVLHLSVAS